MQDAVTKLIVFSDDWGRHQSSCQHLIRALLPRHPTLWVNTTGTRKPTPTLADFKRVAGKVFASKKTVELPANLSVIGPRMWPGFRTPWQRRFNALWIAKAVNRRLGPRQPHERRVAITTIPITADLIGKLQVDRWVYYCVDDFSVWPGLDGDVMNQMEREQVTKVDTLVAVSETLQKRLSDMGRESTLLTHGANMDHWTVPAALPEATQLAEPAQTNSSSTKNPKNTLPPWWPKDVRPIYLFWGLVDARLDESWCKALADGAGTLILAGPQQSPPPGLMNAKNILMPGAVRYEMLPAIAMAADVLVMPYADLPVTRAMQPLKLKEYLAAGFPTMGRPVVVRDLPATAEWRDAADVVARVEEFVSCAKRRAAEGLPEAQKQARMQRLPGETWDGKARQFEQLLEGNRSG